MRDFVIKCDECGCDSPSINTKNEIIAQNILVEHHGWRVYPAFEEILVKKFKYACKECVRRYAIRRSKQEKRIRDGQTRGSS